MRSMAPLFWPQVEAVGVAVGVGAVVLLATVAVAIAVQPPGTDVTVTVKLPAARLEISSVVAPFDQIKV